MKNSKWLVIVLIYNVEDDEQISSESLAIDKNLWIGTTKYENFNSKNVQVVFVVVQKNKLVKDEIETVIYEKRDNTNHYKKINHNLKSELILVHYHATAELFAYLNTLYTSERKMVITLGHGSVFGINYFDLSTAKMINKDYKENNITLNNISEYFGNIGENILKENYINNINKIDNKEDYELNYFVKIKEGTLYNSYQLSNKELSLSFNSLSKQDTNKPVDILVINNCFMQNIFAQCDFSKTVDYYVAPISGISYPGYNFIEILRKINISPNESTETVANLFVAKDVIESHALYKNTRVSDYSKIAIDNRWFLQAIKLDTQVYVDLKDKFKNYINELYTICKNISLMKIFIKDTFYSCYKYSDKSLDSLNLIDFQVFVVSLNDLLVRNNNNRIANLQQFYKYTAELISVFNKLSFTNYCGKDFIVNWENFNDKYLAANKIDAIKKIGLGFYLSKKINPKSPLEVILSTNNPFKPDIIDNTHYFDLLKFLSGSL